MPAKILLLTSVDWPFAARLASAFAATGASVDAFAPRGHVIFESRFVAGRHVYAPLSPLRSLARAFARAEPQLIVACDDRVIGQVLSLWRRARAQADRKTLSLIAQSLGHPDAYDDLRSRSRFMAEAKVQGLRSPLTRLVATPAALERALDEIGLPAVLKCDGSWGGDGVALAHSRDEARHLWNAFTRGPSRLRSAYRSLSRRDLHHLAAALRPVTPAIALQAFIEGRPATTSFACWRGEVVAALHFDVVASSGSRKPASVLRRVDDPDMDEAARRIARRYALSGLHGLDFMRDSAGRAHLIEINPRATPTSHLALGEGRDLATALVANAAREALRPRPAVTLSDTIALFPQEWRRDPASPFLVSAFHDVPRDDPRVLAALGGSAGPAEGHADVNGDARPNLPPAEAFQGVDGLSPLPRR